MSSLGPDARALLEATSDGDDPSELDAARVRAKIEQRLLLSAAGVAGASSAAAAAHASGANAASATVVTSSGGAAGGVLSGAAGTSLPTAGSAALSGVAGAAASSGAGSAALAGATVGSTSLAAGKVLLVVALAGGAVGTGIEIQRSWRAPEPSLAVTRPSSSRAAVPNATQRSNDEPASASTKKAEVAEDRERDRLPAPASGDPLPRDRSEPLGEQRDRPKVLPRSSGKLEPKRSSAPKPASVPRARVDRRDPTRVVEPTSTESALRTTPALAAHPSRELERSESRPPAHDSILEEAALLRAARSALARGDAATALTRLDEHTTRFPRAALREEAAAARVLALCGAGRAAEARAAAADFLAHHPSSPLAAQVHWACAAQSGTVRGR